MPLLLLTTKILLSKPKLRRSCLGVSQNRTAPHSTKKFWKLTCLLLSKLLMNQVHPEFSHVSFRIGTFWFTPIWFMLLNLIYYFDELRHFQISVYCFIFIISFIRYLLIFLINSGISTNRSTCFNLKTFRNYAFSINFLVYFYFGSLKYWQCFLFILFFV